MKVTAVLLAAGQGTRMKSNLPKVLHPIAGLPMVFHVLQATREATTEKPILVIGHGAEAVRTAVGDLARFVLQEQQLGTGHAVLQAEGQLKGRTELVLVAYADMPLLRSETLQQVVEVQKTSPGAVTILTVTAPDVRGFGRVVRNSGGEVQAIVEENQASPEQLKIHELNVGVYCFQAEWLWDALRQIRPVKKGEYYLTDCVELAVKMGLPVQTVTSNDLDETIGINTRVHLAEAEAAMRKRIRRVHMLAGITILDPDTTYIDLGVRIGQDTMIWPNTHLLGKTQIGRSCVIGPNSLVRDTTIGNNCTVLASVLEEALLEDDVDMGPFSHLRRGARLCKGVHLGNFGEVKESILGPGVKMGHFSYIGNARIGAETNVGAGTITCNFDGEQKNPTEIGEDVFIGSDTMLVAPVKVGDRARTGAGSVVTKDVPADTLAVGVPARAIRKLEPKEKKNKS